MSWALKIEELVAATQGRFVSGRREWFYGVGTDTRADLNGKIFFALKGDQFDAHQYLEAAVKAGAQALVVHDVQPALALQRQDIAIIEVNDTLVALQKLATYWRERNRFTVVGITGSNGKTTCKEYSATLLKEKFKTHWSKGSFNNHWGVPITILEAAPDTEVVVCEMGMNHAGELTELSQIAKPNFVLCTTVARAHLGHFKDTSEIAAAKNEIYVAAPSAAVGIFNLDGEHTVKMMNQWQNDRLHSKIWTYSARSDNAPQESNTAHSSSPDVRFILLETEQGGMRVETHIQGQVSEVKVPVFGEHNVQNLAASSAVALAAGVPVEKILNGLPKCQNAWGRNQWLKASVGANILFDGYNANPESMTALLKNTQSLPGAKVALLGEMREMGDAASGVHEEIGEKAAQVGFRWIAFVGGAFDSFKKGLERGAYRGEVVHFEKSADAAPWIAQRLEATDLLAVKASRGIALEKALSPLIEGGFAKE